MEELLVIVNCPVTAPAVVGSNCTVSVAVWLGVKVSGKVAPETVKPVPITVAALTVTDAVPVEVKITDCVVGVFKFTSPKTRLVTLTLSVGVAVPNCKLKVSVTLPALALSVTAAPELTEEIVAVKLALVAPAATVTEAGTVTALLLLARFTVNPPPAAAAFSVTVQLSVPALDIDPLAQLSAVRTGTPVPLRLTADEPLVEANLRTKLHVPTLNCPNPARDSG